MNNEQNLTQDSIEAIRAEIYQLLREGAQTSLENKEGFRELREDSRKLREEQKETDKQLKKLGQYIGGIAHSNGEMAEEYFYNSFKADKTFANEKFDRIKRNMAFKGMDKEAEFDLVLFNGKSAALIEIKYNAKPKNISVEKIISRVEIFRTLVPECENYNIYLGVAAMSFKEGLEAELHQAGIATVRPIGKKMVVFDKDVKVF